jgi:hypothetical protein
MSMLPIRPGISRQLSAAAMQVPMLSSPLKQTNEIEWIQPIKQHIRSAYGDDPEQFNDECAQLNRLRQDMRGAGQDSAAGRDLLYRYYGQLEFLDLRFPIDENHIKISFTWFDAFTHKPTSQYSLAYEKASIIFNISAVLSCHAANQNRHEDTGLKTAYHSFQASAGMFTYINENFLHAPSTDLSRDTVKTLISIMLAQGQEVFIEKQVVDKKKPGLIGKLAAQAAYLYAEAVQGVQENVSKAVFERVWLQVVQIKQHHMASVAQYFQAVADYEANKYGEAICRLQAAQHASKEALRIANSFPGSVPSNSNLGSETGTILVDMTKKQLASIQELLTEYVRDNDMIYHQPVPAEANLPSIPKLPAAKPMPVSELYQGQDIQRIIGPDIFQRIVPMAVTESASLYDEEKAKLVRAEAERIEVADSELVTSLDYMKLPGSLSIIKGTVSTDITVDEDFRTWCSELANHTPLIPVFEVLRTSKTTVLSILDDASKQLDMEESVCEKMRSKYGADWTQQPSSRLTATLRGDARNYRSAVEEASTSDAQLYATFRQHESDMDEMRSAGETDEADVLYQRAMLKASAGKKAAGASGTSGQDGDLLGEDFDDEARQSISEQVERVEGLLQKLNLVKRERAQVLKDLKEKVQTDDISNTLILSVKKPIVNPSENPLFKQELEKFRPHQTRILQALHKQQSLLKELGRTYNDLLADRRVRKEQDKYEGFVRQRNSVLAKYKKVFQAFRDLNTGLDRARQFYEEMVETSESLKSNVESFVENRRSEGGQLLQSIEIARSAGAGGPNGSAEREQARMRELMERMSVNQTSSPAPPPPPSQPPLGGGYEQPQRHRPAPLQSFSQQAPGIASYNPAASPPVTPRYTGLQQPGAGGQYPQPHQQQQQQHYPHRDSSYVPSSYAPISPPPQQQFFNAPQPGQSQQSIQNNAFKGYGQPATQMQPQPGQYGGAYPQQQQQQQQQQHFSPPPTTSNQAGGGGWQVPPPPPGPPPPNAGQDPWAGLNSWK